MSGVKNKKAWSIENPMRVVVVGGGFGGVKTALDLANQEAVHVQLITKHTNFEYHGALYRTATGSSPLEVSIPLRDIFSKADNVEVVLDEATTIDTEKQFIHSSTNNAYAYDKLVLALGNQVNYFGIEGMAEHSMSMNTVPDVIELRYKLAELAKNEKLLNPSVVIVGAGATGVELSGDIQTFVDSVTDSYSKPHKDFRVTIVEGSDRVLPPLDAKCSQKALKRLQSLGIKVRLNTLVKSCSSGQLVTNKDPMSADLIVWTAGSRAVDFYSDNSGVFSIEHGRVLVDKYMRALGSDNIYVIGDNALTKYTGMAQTALHDAKYVARNFIRELKSQNLVAYRARKPIYVVPIGPRWAVLQTAKTKTSGYKAWLVRRQADLWIFRNFKPYKEAVKQWRRGDRRSKI